MGERSLRVVRRSLPAGWGGVPKPGEDGRMADEPHLGSERPNGNPSGDWTTARCGAMNRISEIQNQWGRMIPWLLTRLLPHLTRRLLPETSALPRPTGYHRLTRRTPYHQRRVETRARQAQVALAQRPGRTECAMVGDHEVCLSSGRFPTVKEPFDHNVWSYPDALSGGAPP